MNRSQIENLYKVNGLKDYKLKTTEDLLKVHGLDIKAVDGYNRLNDLNRQIYEKFIVNIFNAWGLESRAALVPKGIYYVEHIQQTIEESDEDGKYRLCVGSIINAIDRNGMKYVLHTWRDSHYANHEILNEAPEYYLRFEYEYDGCKEWLHVIKEGCEWY